MLDRQNFRQHSRRVVSQTRLQMRQEQKKALLGWRSGAPGIHHKSHSHLIHARCRAQLLTAGTGCCVRCAVVFSFRRKNFDTDFQQHIGRALIHGDAPTQAHTRDSEHRRLHKSAGCYRREPIPAIASSSFLDDLLPTLFIPPGSSPQAPFRSKFPSTRSSRRSGVG